MISGVEDNVGVGLEPALAERAIDTPVHPAQSGRSSGWVEGSTVSSMTLTSPACPVGPLLQAQVHAALLKLPGVKEAKVELVWDPPWDPRTMATDEIKMELGLL